MYSVLLLGPSLSAVSGVSTHLNQLFASTLADEFNLIHFQVGSEGRQESKRQKLQRFLLSPFALALKIVDVQPDIVHLNTSMDQKGFWRDAAYLMVAKLLRKRVVYQIHGGELPQQFFKGKPLLTGLLRRLLTWPDAIVLLASIEHEAYRAFAPFKYLSVIPNAIDLHENAGVGERMFSQDPIQLGYIGRLAPAKGLFEAIEALNILRDAGVENIHFTIAGSGPSDTELRTLVNALGLENVVDFVGAVFGEAKTRFWRQMDIFIFPTYAEGLPYTVLESIAFGTPMVTTQVGGIPDVIKDGVHGLFVEPHDAEAVASAIKNLIGDRERLRKMSSACTSRAREFYGVDRLARQFSELYASLMR